MVVANINKYNRCIGGIETVCKNLENIGTSITIICNIIELTNAKIINGFDFSGILKVEFFSLLQLNT